VLASPERWPVVALICCLTVYLIVSLSYLKVFPIVGEDEPWIAAAPHKLATQGVYGSDLFAGYYGVERHNYQHMPVYPLLQAAVFAVAGTGVLQMRLLPVAFGFALLVVVYLVGRQAAGARAGILAVVLLLVIRIADGGGATGNLLLDRVRINRYDVAVPVFGLLALWMFNRAEARRSPGGYLVSGVLVGLASLSHLHGIFWLPVLLIMVAIARRSRLLIDTSLWLLLAGFALTWLPWIGYVASGSSDFAGQMRFVSPRFDLLTPSFYTRNVFSGGGPLSLDWFQRSLGEMPASRVGTWSALAGLPVALVAILLALRRRSLSMTALPVAISFVVIVMLFVVLIHVKTYNYMIAVWPVAALVLAIGAIELLRHGGLTTRALLGLLLGSVAIEGTMRVLEARKAAGSVTSYERYTAEVGRCIPEGSLVLGLQHYWLGLRQYRYRTWLVAANNAHPLYADHPIPFDEAIERIDPDVLLVDRYIDRMLRNARDPSHVNHHLYLGFQAFVSRRNASIVCVIRDRSYGDMRVYLVPQQARLLTGSASRAAEDTLRP
jgi:4-amino-4-deoxy-L-arabinose transferase-like glycosyltransferase